MVDKRPRSGWPPLLAAEPVDLFVAVPMRKARFRRSTANIRFCLLGLKLFSARTQASTSVPWYDFEKCLVGQKLPDLALIGRMDVRNRASNLSTSKSGSTLPVLRRTQNGPRPDRRYRARQTSGTADRTPAAPSVDARSAPYRTPAVAGLAAAFPVRSRGGPEARTSPRTRHSARTAPHRRSSGSPATDDPSARAARDRHTKTTNQTAGQNHASQAIPTQPASGNHSAAISARAFSTAC